MSFRPRTIEEYAVCYKDHKGEKQTICTFWQFQGNGYNHFTEVDEENLPSKRELSQLFKKLVTTEVWAEETGRRETEEE